MSGSDVDARVSAAIDAFADGEPVLVHDFDHREDETDVVYPAGSVEPADVARLRRDAGGLVCVALAHETADAFGLPLLSDAIDHPSVETDELGYGDRSSFSLTVNHRETFTGITDDDRALTIARLARAARSPADVEFAAEFRAPGHVQLLKAAAGLLADRRGHTELGLALAAAAGREPAVVVCEMLDSTTGSARSRASARAYARERDLHFLDGAAVVDVLG